MNPGEEKKESKGSRNILIMGLGSIVIALLTTGISLAIYHNSGNIYLDRSRPGFLPDKEEIEEDAKKQDSDYALDKSGIITVEILDEYLEHYSAEELIVDSYNDAFDIDVLSDTNLGIGTEEPADIDE